MDLKSFREDKLKMTQADFAILIGEEQSSVSRWEKSGEPPLKVLEKIAQKTGTDFNTLLGYEKPILRALEVDNSWLKADFTKRTLIDYIRVALDNTNIPDEQRQAYVDDLRVGVEATLVKPQITIVGRSDTGKSTLINALLGADKMPTSWTPTTSIAVYIKHIKDKPAFIEEDVWVFTNHMGNEDLWNERRLHDEDYCRSWKIGAGGVEILRAYGTRQGEHYSKNAGAAVMFIDAPILDTCDIVDLPGFGTETESDDNITFKATQRADVIIYLSQANGFMRFEDISYLKRNISELPVWESKGTNTLKPLSNLFVVASQAHTVNNGNPEQLKGILDTGCSNLLKTLSTGYWNNRKTASGYTNKGYGAQELRSRFFTYTTDIPDLCTRFNDELKTILEALPIVIDNTAKSFVAEYVKSRKPTLLSEIDKYEGIVAERDNYVYLLNEIDKNELARIQDNDKRKSELRTAINTFRDESVQEFSEYCASLINTDSIISLIKTRKISNKKSDVEQFASWLQSTMQERCEEILSSKSERLSEKTQDYINAFSADVAKSFEKSAINVGFDAAWAFASGLSKVGAIGGLAGILGVGIFGAVYYAGLGLSVLGAATLPFVGAIAPFLGPIGLGIGLLLGAVLGVIKLFGGGWEKSVAKKIVAAIDENDVVEKFRSAMQDYWKQTTTAFDQAAQELDEEWANYVSNLRNTIESYDVVEIQHNIATLKCLSDFFDNIPL